MQVGINLYGVRNLTTTLYIHSMIVLLHVLVFQPYPYPEYMFVNYVLLDGTYMYHYVMHCVNSLLLTNQL